MRASRAIFLCCLLALGTLCAAQSSKDPINPAGHLRGKKAGNYTFKIVGQYVGQGKAVITPLFISISANVTTPDGRTSTITFNNMPLVNDRFRGSVNCWGTVLSISGRVDMPANTDDQQTPTQAVTGRVTAQILDPSGKGSRLVAVEDPASRALVPTH